MVSEFAGIFIFKNFIMCIGIGLELNGDSLIVSVIVVSQQVKVFSDEVCDFFFAAHMSSLSAL